MEKTLQAVSRAIGSNKFFMATLILFAGAGAFVAVTGQYSMAFDEYYHLGAIQQYSHIWFPWQITQPDGPARLGALTTDTSYLFHYLMSFPYRLLQHGNLSIQTTLTVLRLVDVGIMIAGIAIFRKMLRELGASQAVAHGILMVLMLLPVTPFLAGQLSYDTLMFTLAGAVFLASVLLIKDIRAGTIQLNHVLITALLIGLACLTKYAFVVVGVTICIILVVEYVLAYGRSEARQRKHPFTLSMAWTQVRIPLTLLLIVSLLFTATLVVERYGLNTYTYRTPVPGCGAVLGEERCQAYAPYGRNMSYREKGYNELISTSDIVEYPLLWQAAMTRSLTFTVGPEHLQYPVGEPLLPARAATIVIGYITLALIAIGIGRYMRRPELRLVALASFAYIGLLFARNISEFIAYGVPVAINARYLLFVLPIFAYLGYYSLTHHRLIVRYPGVIQSIVFACCIAVAGLAYAGHIVPYIIESSDEWMWPNMVEMTNHIRAMLWPVIWPK